MLSLTEPFASLHSPLANSLWSWGARRDADGAVFLRVWQDECRTIAGRPAVRITARAYFADKPDNLGWKERLAHVALIRAGCPAYLIMCTAANTQVEPRTIQHFNASELSVAGALFEHEGDYWLELAGRRSIASFRTNPTPSDPRTTRST